MELTRRFVFHGNASAYSGRLYRPKNVVIDSGAASSLTVAGGLSRARSKRAEFLDGFLRFGAAETEAQGDFDDRKGAIALTHHKIEEETLSTTTKVKVWVENIQVGGRKPRLSIGWAGGAKISHCAPGEESSFRLISRDTGIEEVVVDGVKLKITLNTAVLDKLDTMSKVQTAIVDPAFNRDTNDCFFREAFARWNAKTAGTSRTTTPQEEFLGTLVHKLEWGTKAGHPTAKTNRNSIVIPDIGTVYFGEILVRSHARRVTMVRMELGSHVGGRVASAEYDGNGGSHPP